nr:replication protein A 70 kDa DNA-binding subunit B [Tanacetum cinerariifolium]
MEHTHTQLCDIDPMLDDIKICAFSTSIIKRNIHISSNYQIMVKTKESKEKNSNGSSKPAIVFKKDIQVIDLTDDEVISSLVFHPYLPLQIPHIKSIKVDLMLYDIKFLARCISIWKAHPSGNPNNICSLDIVFIFVASKLT